MRRSVAVRLLSCFLAGLLLMEAPIQVEAAPENGAAVPGEETAGEPEVDVLTDAEDSVVQTENQDAESEEAEEKKDGDPEATDDDLQEPGKLEDPEGDIPEESEEEKGETEDSSLDADEKTPEDPAIPEEELPDDANSVIPEEPEEVEEEQQEEKMEYLTLSALQYGTLPEYSEGFDNHAVEEVLQGVSEALSEEDTADISNYGMSSEQLSDILTWLVNHEEAYYTLLPYIEYTYVEKGEDQEVQKVTVSRVSEEELLSLTAVRNMEEVELSFVPADGIEQYRLFRICADELTELPWEEDRGIFTDSTPFESQTDCEYVLCGYQTTEEGLKLCAFSQRVSGEYELMPPENLEAESGKDSVTLSWDEVDLASGYEIEVSDQENGTFVLIGQVEGTEYVQEELTDGEERYYKVRAFQAADAQMVYSDSSAVVRGVALSAPVLAATTKDDTVTLTWKDVEGATHYFIYELLKDGTYQYINKVQALAGVSFTHTVTGVKLGETHTYVVAAASEDVADNQYDSTKMSLSNEVEATINFGAVKLQCSSSNYKQVALKWSKSFGAKFYRVERKTDKGSYAVIADEIPLSTLAYTDNGVKANTKYTYRIIPYQVVNGTKVEGAASNEISVTPVLPAVKSASVTKVDYKSLKITWSKVTGATGYQVYRSTSKSGTYSRVATISSGSTVSYQNTKLEPGVSYYYKVRAFCSDKSGTVYGEYSPITGGVTSLNKVSGVKTSSSAYNSIKLTWSKVPGATGYVIERSENGSTYKSLKTIGSGSTVSYTDANKISFNKKYYYRIRAYYKRSDGKNTYGSYSSAVSGVSKLAATKITSTSSVNYNTVKITWAKVAGASGYKVYRATSANGSYSTVATIKSGSTVSWQNSGLTMDKTYYYKVRPYRVASGKEVYGSYSSAVKAIPKLGKVTKEKAVSASYNSIKVSWTKTAGASGYVVYYSTSKNSGYKTLKTVTGTSYTHTGLTAGKTYYYKIRAYKTVSGKKVYGGYSTVVSAKAVPATVSAKRSTVTYNSVKLTWSKISGSSGYEIYRSGSKNGTYSKIKTITSGSSLSYTNTGLATGKVYYYKVRAYRTVGGKKIYGSFSAIVNAQPKLNTPALKRSTVTYNSVKMTWNKISGANGYDIYRSTSKTGTYEHIKRISSGSTLSYTDTSLTTGKTYYYKVRAYRTVSGKKVYSTFSGLINAKPVLSKVTGLKAVPTGSEKTGSIKLTWSKVNGATGYVITRATSKSGTYKTVKTINSGSTLSYTNSGLAFGQSYYYKVQATRGTYKSSAAGPAHAMVIAMSLSDSSLSMSVGDTEKLAVATIPKVEVSWSTSDKKVAKVDSNGKVTAVGAGKATIYVKANGLTKSVKVTVKGPSEYKGIDVSSYQGSIDWKKVADSGIDFAMMRLMTGTSSSTTRDTSFKDNYNAARDNGIKIGVYRYSYAYTRTKARQEAENAINALNGRKLDYPIVMDMEDSSILSKTNSNQRRSEIILAFKEVVEDAGYEFALYANTTWLNNYLDMDMLKDVDIWVARWRSPEYGHGYKGKGNVTMWQYSSTGRVNGISGNVDLNISYKDY